MSNSASGISDEDVALMIENATLRAEISGLRARIRDLQALADADPVLPLANRRAFEADLARRICQVRDAGVSAALIFIDVNGLKAINDGLGHAAGDALLHHVATILNDHARPGDMAARIGGDEMALLLGRANPLLVTVKAELIARTVAARPVSFGKTTMPARIAIGTALVRADDTPASLIARADAAMYARKGIGRR